MAKVIDIEDFMERKDVALIFNENLSKEYNTMLLKGYVAAFLERKEDE